MRLQLFVSKLKLAIFKGGMMKRVCDSHKMREDALDDLSKQNTACGKIQLSTTQS